MYLERLVPPGPRIDVEEMLGALDPVRSAPAERPHVLASLISSVDGRATLGGTSAGLGDAADRAIFRGLRGAVDAILVGTGTLRDERYGRAGRSRALRGIRTARGLPEEPTIMIVSRSLDLPVDIPLLADPASRVRLYTTSVAPVPAMGAQVEVTRLAPRADLDEVLRIARAEHGIRAIDCEGGPTLLARLLALDVVDELFLTYAPFWAGAGELALAGPRQGGGPLALELRAVYRRASRLYLRYARTRPRR
ncbi:MAG TPA: dihydrofolate reductase family protein [Solirubrobacteraceae bacterium]